MKHTLVQLNFRSVIAQGHYIVYGIHFIIMHRHRINIKEVTYIRSEIKTG